MKYIRTDDGVYEIEREERFGIYYKINPQIAIYCDEETTKKYRQADSIVELCDTFVVETKCKDYIYHIAYDELDWAIDKAKRGTSDYEIYGAIWTDKGLIYVAKMNEDGELELI